MRQIIVAVVAFVAFWNSTQYVSADGLRPFGSGSWAAILQEHAGRSFIVHFWGLTCGPCRTEMPEWGRLQSERNDMTLVLVNADFVQDSPAESLRFLEVSGLAHAEKWLFSDRFAQKLYFEINRSWQGEIPATVLVDRSGKREWISGSVEPARIRTWLDQQKASN